MNLNYNIKIYMVHASSIRLKIIANYARTYRIMIEFSVSGWVMLKNVVYTVERLKMHKACVFSSKYEE